MERDRVISITLSEAEWQAFVARQPQPVDWLRAQIQNEVQAAGREPERLGDFQFTIKRDKGLGINSSFRSSCKL